MTSPSPLAAETGRALWQPNREEQMAAVEILLASPIPRELRLVLRDFAVDLTFSQRKAS